MRIYVDESGSFDVQPNLRRPVSCVGALVIPEAVHDDLIMEYRSLRLRWLRGGREVKGRELMEADFEAVLDVVSRYDVLFEVVGADRSLTTRHDVVALQRSRATQLRARTGGDDRLHDGRLLAELADAYEAQSTSDFLQGLVTESLIWQVIQAASAYYVQRIPRELARFEWVFDAKQAGSSPTPPERLWRDIVAPIVASCHRLHLLPKADYSAFSRFFKQIALSIPAGGDPPSDGNHIVVTDLNQVMCEHLSYVDSRSDLGIELVDVVLSAFSRAVNGTLQFPSWRKLGRLIVSRPPTSVNVILPKIGVGPTVFARVGYGTTLRHLHLSAKPMFTPDNSYMQPALRQLDLTPGA